MWSFNIQNIGGIRDGEASLKRGINTVQAENWQGKSSFITAIQTVMGTTGMEQTNHPLTEGASEGRATLETEYQTYVTTLDRDGRTVTRSGDTYITETENRVYAQFFAFLGEDNPIRAAVRTDGDLAELLSRPLDLENIDEQISELQRERRQVETDLDRATRAAEQLPRIQEDITQLEQKLENLRDEYDELTAETDDRDNQAALRDELSAKRATRNQLRGDIDRIENTIERTESRLEQKQREREELELPDELEIEADIDEKQARIAELRTQIEILEDVHSANKRILDGNQFHLITDVERSIAGDEFACWTCGAATTEGDLKDRLNDLQAKISVLRSERKDLKSKVEEIQCQRNEIERKQRKRRTLENEIGDLEADLDNSRRDLENRKERLMEVRAEIEALDEKVEETDYHLTDLKSEIKVKKQELERKEEKLTELENQKADRAERQEQYDSLGDEIAKLRDRKRNKQQELAEQFEDAMDDIIDRFEPGFESARLESKTNAADEIVDFDIIVAREGREASLDALSEGELEILGIVTALAGYKTFNVADQVPAILLDDIGALSSRRIRSLVEYLSDEADYLVTTAYPEAGEFQGHTISPNEWDVISDRKVTTP